MDNFADRLQKSIIEKKNPTVMGLDPLLEYLPAYMLEEFKPDKALDKEDFFDRASAAILAFNKELMDGVKDLIPAVKPQIAYYEILGSQGIRAYIETIKYAKKLGFIVIADAKRNDIGSTASMYSRAFLGKTSYGDRDALEFPAFDADALTVNPYLGIDGIQPFVEDCKKYGKGIFALVRTSNPSASDFQDLKIEDGRYLYEAVAERVSAWGEDLVGDMGFSSVGAVVGATWPEEAAILRELMPHTFILVPGYGAQGGTGQNVARSFDSKGRGAIVNASRSLMLAHRKEEYKYMTLKEAVYEEADRMKKDLNMSIFS